MSSFIQNEDTKVIAKMDELLQSYEQELLNFEEYQEFFDDLQVLKSVLSESKTCDEFVQKSANFKA